VRRCVGASVRQCDGRTVTRQNGTAHRRTVALTHRRTVHFQVTVPAPGREYVPLVRDFSGAAAGQDRGPEARAPGFPFMVSGTRNDAQGKSGRGGTRPYQVIAPTRACKVSGRALRAGGGRQTLARTGRQRARANFRFRFQSARASRHRKPTKTGTSLAGGDGLHWRIVGGGVSCGSPAGSPPAARRARDARPICRRDRERRQVLTNRRGETRDGAASACSLVRSRRRSVRSKCPSNRRRAVVVAPHFEAQLALVRQGISPVFDGFWGRKPAPRFALPATGGTAGHRRVGHGDIKPAASCGAAVRAGSGRPADLARLLPLGKPGSIIQQPRLDFASVLEMMAERASRPRSGSPTEPGFGLGAGEVGTVLTLANAQFPPTSQGGPDPHRAGATFSGGHGLRRHAAGALPVQHRAVVEKRPGRVAR